MQKPASPLKKTYTELHTYFLLNKNSSFLRLLYWILFRIWNLSMYVLVYVCVDTHTCKYTRTWCTRTREHAKPEILCSQILPVFSLLPFVLLGWFAGPWCEWAQYLPAAALAEVRGPVWVQGKRELLKWPKALVRPSQAPSSEEQQQQQEGARYLCPLWRE